MTPIALYLAKQLEDTHPSDSACQLLMYNAADELKKQHEKIKELEAQLKTPNVLADRREPIGEASNERSERGRAAG